METFIFSTYDFGCLEQKRKVLGSMKKNILYCYLGRLFNSKIFEKGARILQWIIMASLTYACFVPAKGLIRALSANSSKIAFEVPLASK